MTGLSVRNLSFSYGSRRALSDVSFDIPQGAFCALLGPNGAGKSTLFGLLTRLFTSPEGTITVAGHELRKTPRAALAEIGVVFQQSTLDVSLSVERNLKYFAALHGLAGAEAARRIDAALDRLDMAERRRETVRDLNGGHRRRTEIARALIHSPSVLLLDEPTVGLDAASRAAITAHVHDLAAETGLTVLWATHLTDEIRDTDQLLILHKGEIRADGTAAEIRGNTPLTEHFLRVTAQPA
ncbi:ABC transporter [Dinoroseobacter shibae DFL 12 = DSM 16493]|uniref:ABC transporter n=1 Tax=Dinoroseobacter shibae (strain DSM 16493 / NCIMB 14021 / DFL 12) TaxID=398580 RepID=A8LI66_DINSH|nr:ABC transporter ATP-binding protein [Dinoroseobacter shibae]ABV94400.1 ABC transporter [Dinoroseobacter shibae DFL 12 = DSM 16493]URF45828.1 ATP-binding cassette domain-containing protein [Dinoroseobacter shibae]URF50134.1 ATP-binding cassette domain-containing protein [Dinoroseobacter shibae]